jgi:serine/threonine protein kinase
VSPVQIMIQVSEKVNVLHEAGVAHLDLQPQNLLYCPAEKAWSLCNFSRSSSFGARRVVYADAHVVWRSLHGGLQRRGSRSCCRYCSAALSVSIKCTRPLMGMSNRALTLPRARTGEQALRGAMFLAYAAPDVALSWQGGGEHFEADPATDVWSLGVIFYELLTQQRYFADAKDEKEVAAMLLGEAALPHERPAADACNGTLGVLKPCALL